MNKSKISNLFLIFFIILMIIPQTRTPLQIALHKALTLIRPIQTINTGSRIKIEDFDWQLKKEDGTIYNFTESKGKVVIINFWATWCPPCIAEMPSFQKLYNKYGKDVVFLFVTNDTVEKIREFKKSRNYTFPVYNIRSNYPEKLVTKSIPRTIIINKGGEFIIDESGAINWFSDNVQKEIDSLIK